jgi:hypothetical protein
MKANPAEKVRRRVAVILGPGGSSVKLLDVVLPLLGRDRSIEMQGIFLEEAELKHAAELPFVKELCRVTFNVREFNSDQFDRVLALRMRTAQRALSLLAKRAGVTHSFRNVRGSAARLLFDTASQADIVIFEPARNMAAAMSTRPVRTHPLPRIAVALGDPETSGGALLAAVRLAGGEMRRISVWLTPGAVASSESLEKLLAQIASGSAAQIRTLPDFSVESLVSAARSEGSSMLVLAATSDLMQAENLHILHQSLRCPICLVRSWDSED